MSPELQPRSVLTEEFIERLALEHAACEALREGNLTTAQILAEMATPTRKETNDDHDDT
ncbi:hypothetical protein [Brevibacterium otitidis]|uniref:Uncharacterized protein n=1 Tax=Brevibacterium otitidis TaxID=53364 RepID=A0ABV5X4G4_9MICO|nr:hypothetical protein GCM10023233_22970 [Brevibacterium otitidis]